MRWILGCLMLVFLADVAGARTASSAPNHLRADVVVRAPSSLLVAAVLVGEAGCEGEHGMKAVLEVIHRRCSERHLTPLQVVTQRKQFSCLNRGEARLFRLARAHPAWPAALRIAALTPAQLGAWRTRGANSFTRKTERPWWARGHQPTVILGNHAFYAIR